MDIFNDIVLQHFTDLKIKCRGSQSIFNVHRIAVCTKNTYFKNVVEALSPGEDINLPKELAIMSFVIDAIYLRQFDTETVLEGVNNNHFLILLEVYAMAEKYGVDVAMRCVLKGLDEVMRDMMFSVSLALPDPVRTRGAVVEITKVLKFLQETPEALDDDLRQAVTQGFGENHVHVRSQETYNAVLSLPADPLDGLA